MHMLNIVAIAFGAWFVYLIALIVYRLFFHPYAKYPGPLLGKITYWYAFYHAWVDQTAPVMLQCHQKYGQVVRWNPDALMFADPEVIKEVNSPGKNFRKGKAYEPLNPNPHGRPALGFTLDKDSHARKRRIIGQAFSKRALLEFEPCVQYHLKVLEGVLSDLSDSPKNEWSDPVNFQDLIRWLTQDILTDLIFGESYNALINPNMRAVGDLGSDVMLRIQLVFAYPGLFRSGKGRWSDLGTWILPDKSAAFVEFLKHGAMSASKRLNSEGEKAIARKDVLEYLISARDPETGAGIEQQDIIAEASGLLLGSPTWLTSLSILFFHLSRNANRHTFEKLVAEVRSKFVSAADISMKNVTDCAYLQATVLESLRFMASKPFWRDAGPGGATILMASPDTLSTETLAIPQGMTVGVCQHAVVRNDEYFPDAYVFAPERFLEGSDFYTSRGYSLTEGEAMRERSRRFLHPFGVGGRSCPAQNMVLEFEPLMLARIVHGFDIKQAAGPEGYLGQGGPDVKGTGRDREDECQMYGTFTSNVLGPIVQIKHAKSAELL